MPTLLTPWFYWLIPPLTAVVAWTVAFGPHIWRAGRPLPSRATSTPQTALESAREGQESPSAALRVPPTPPASITLWRGL